MNVEHWQDNGVFDGAAWSGIDTVGARGLNKDKGLLDDPLRGGAFTVARLDGIRNAGSTDSFYGRLEGSPHNNGHVICGATATGKSGHMGSGL